VNAVCQQQNEFTPITFRVIARLQLLLRLREGMADDLCNNHAPSFQNCVLKAQTDIIQSIWDDVILEKNTPFLFPLSSFLFPTPRPSPKIRALKAHDATTQRGMTAAEVAQWDAQAVRPSNRKEMEKAQKEAEKAERRRKVAEAAARV
jgi:hypothetical protein